VCQNINDLGDEMAGKLKLLTGQAVTFQQYKMYNVGIFNRNMDFSDI
jgi:hypothetical protein